MNKNMTFEQALERLEEIVSKLESGNVSLDESIEIYQEGIMLSKQCSGMLQEAEGKVMAIVNKEQDVLEEFIISQVKEA
ncbi:MAG: exodeoxyribonuclease small subunit [Clostridia bacterium]|jgi:exodeoxyribonuclease VII small subunit|nr:exodeoxyribonuclease small subunit [Clostridia bacterium]